MAMRFYRAKPSTDGAPSLFEQCCVTTHHLAQGKFECWDDPCPIVVVLDRHGGKLAELRYRLAEVFTRPRYAPIYPQFIISPTGPKRPQQERNGSIRPVVVQGSRSLQFNNPLFHQYQYLFALERRLRGDSRAMPNPIENRRRLGHIGVACRAAAD
jgi:hypothetical protein